MGYFDFASRASAPRTPQDELVAQIEQLHKDGKDLSRVTQKIDALEAAKKARIEKALDSTLDLASMGPKTKSRRFRVAVYVNDGVEVGEGIEYPDPRTDYSKKHNQELVYLSELAPRSTQGQYYDMEAFKKTLTDNGIVHRIAYID